MPSSDQTVDAAHDLLDAQAGGQAAAPPASSQSGAEAVDIEALMQEVEALELPPSAAGPAPGQVEEPPAEHPQPHPAPVTAAAAVSQGASEALGQVDQALANELDTLLQGDFESIDAVLDGVFDEQAVLVQASEHAKAASPKKAEIESAASRETDAVHDVDGPPKVAAATAAPPLGTTHGPEAIAPAGEPAPVVLQQATAPVATAVPAQETESASAVVAEVVQSSPPAPSALTIPSVALDRSSPVPSANPDRPAPAASLSQTASALVHTCVGTMSTGARQALVLMNAPLGALPAGQRRLVDVVAVSLALWAPLCWVLPGLLPRPTASSTASSHGSPPAHHESGHAPSPDDHAPSAAPAGHGSH